MDGEMVGQGGRLETLTTGTLQNLGYLYDAVGKKTIQTMFPATVPGMFTNHLLQWMIVNPIKVTMPCQPIAKYAYDCWMNHASQFSPGM